MAAHRSLTTCSQALQRSRAVAYPGAAQRHLQEAAAASSQCAKQSRNFGTGPSPPQSLYLDFLAPSWRTINTTPSTSAIQRTPRSSRLNNNSRHESSQRRAFSQITSRQASTAAPAKPIVNPRQDESGNEMTITITPRAAHRLHAISQTDNNPNLALRVAVESGGCHGFQYLMSLTSTEEVDAEEDTLFENTESANTEGENEYKAKVVMDEPSLELLKGSSIDYTMELIGSQFKVTGIPGAKSSCGCGTSFDIA